MQWHQQFSCTCVCAECICNWILVIYMMIFFGVWDLLFPVMDCTEEKLLTIVSAVYCCETMSGRNCKSCMYFPSSLDKFLCDAQSMPTTYSLSVICRKHCVNCIYSGNFSASSTCSVLTVLCCVNWTTADSSLWPFCNSKPQLFVLCM